jgi:sulfatase modifying factor 1
VDVGSDGGTTYEPGWHALDDISVAPTNVNLTSCSPYSTWTSSPGMGESRPINCVNWYEAYAFCIWDGGFLPSDTEWEYAAAGGTETREFPWGPYPGAPTDQGPATQYAINGCQYPNRSDDAGDGGCTGVANIAPVGTAMLGAGLWGQLDLAGNVFQWTFDSYCSSYVNHSCSYAYINPCPDCANMTAFTDERVTRGSGFGTGLFGVLDRQGTIATFRDGDFGFRCARAP